MKCKYCGSMPLYSDSKQAFEPIKYIYTCPKCSQSVISTQSKTNARKLWDKFNTVTKQDMYYALQCYLKQPLLNKDCEEIRNIVLEYERKINEVNE